jgi:hypothetical protein
MVYGRRRGGWNFEPENPLSVIDLINYGTLDIPVAGLLWLIMEKRASALVAAGPSRVGKSTTFNVLMDFMRPEIKQVQLQGDYEDFSFVKKAKPANTYMVAEEFGNFGIYVWGEVAVKAFDLTSEGFALGGTIHAQSAREVVEILRRYLGLPMSKIAAIDLIVILSVTAGRKYTDEPVRRIDTVSLVSPHEKGLALEMIASLSADGKSFEVANAADLKQALSAKLDFKNTDIAAGLKEKEEFLTRLKNEGKNSRDEVRKAVIEYYRERPEK